MLEFIHNFFTEFIFEKILVLAYAILVFFFRRYIKRQKQKDAQQDRQNQELKAELDRLLKRREYFDKQLLTSYKQIRKFAQKARDEARLIQTPALISDYNTWKQSLFEKYADVLELLYEHALLLEYFDHYDCLHDFKNSLLSFCLIAQKLNPLKEGERISLMEEYDTFSRSWDILVEQIKFPKEPEHIF